MLLLLFMNCLTTVYMMDNIHTVKTHAGILLWFDDCVCVCIYIYIYICMIDNIHTVKPHVGLLLLGDFNIDLLKPHSSWDCTITLLYLTQLVKSHTKITQTSATLIDHKL